MFSYSCGSHSGSPPPTFEHRIFHIPRSSLARFRHRRFSGSGPIADGRTIERRDAMCDVGGSMFSYSRNHPTQLADLIDRLTV